MVKIEGREALRRKFQAMPQAVREEVKKAVTDSAQELTGMQKRLVPQDKGALAASIRYEQSSDSADDYRATIIAGGTGATRREVRKGSGIFTDEAILVEFGTKPHIAGGKFKGAKHPGTPPRPFFYNSYRALKRRIMGKLSRSIVTGIKKAAK